MPYTSETPKPHVRRGKQRERPQQNKKGGACTLLFPTIDLHPPSRLPTVVVVPCLLFTVRTMAVFLWITLFLVKTAGTDDRTPLPMVTAFPWFNLNFPTESGITGPGDIFMSMTVRLTLTALAVLGTGMGSWCLSVLGLFSLTPRSIIRPIPFRLLVTHLTGPRRARNLIFLLPVRPILLTCVGTLLLE